MISLYLLIYFILIILERCLKSIFCYWLTVAINFMDFDISTLKVIYIFRFYTFIIPNATVIFTFRFNLGVSCHLNVYIYWYITVLCDRGFKKVLLLLVTITIIYQISPWYLHVLCVSRTVICVNIYCYVFLIIFEICLKKIFAYWLAVAIKFTDIHISTVSLKVMYVYSDCTLL